MQTTKIWDADRVEEVAGDDRELFAELCDLFLEDTFERLGKLRNAIQTGSLADVKYEAHSIKGASGNFGAERMFELSKQLEESACADDVPACSATIDALAAGFEELQEEIRRRPQG